MTFEHVWKQGTWTPIRDCPGRFILRGRTPGFSLGELLGVEPDVSRFPESNARDCVLVVRLEDGGIISYQRGDGSFLHTLNTPEGFRRKLEQLGIRVHLPPD